MQLLIGNSIAWNENSNIFRKKQFSDFQIYPSATPTIRHYHTVVKGTVQPFEWWFLRRISALFIEKTNYL
jgi:hypothetical protein